MTAFSKRKGFYASNISDILTTDFSLDAYQLLPNCLGQVHARLVRGGNRFHNSRFFHLNIRQRFDAACF